jgi:hypothetical protein
MKKEETAVCKDCRNVFPLSSFQLDGWGKYKRKYRRNTCNKCRNRNAEGYRRKSGYYSSLGYKERKKASLAVRRAKIVGILKVPDSCEENGCKNESRLEAHHYKGYDPKNHLEVKWLCNHHHRSVHNRL